MRNGWRGRDGKILDIYMGEITMGVGDKITKENILWQTMTKLALHFNDGTMWIGSVTLLR